MNGVASYYYILFCLEKESFDLVKAFDQHLGTGYDPRAKNPGFKSNPP